MKIRVCAAIFVCSALAPSVIGAQEAEPHLAFEVASIKRTEPGTQTRELGFRSGRFYARNVTANFLIRTAYGRSELPLEVSQVVGGPRWLERDRFDVEATAPGTPESARGAFPEPVIQMLRTVVEERFRVKAHMETRQSPILAVVLARRDGTLGPGLRRRTAPCISAAEGDRRRAAGDTVAPTQLCIGNLGPGNISGTGLTLSNLLNVLPSLGVGIDRMLVDRTGLVGMFDVELRWTPTVPLGGGPATSTGVSDAPSFFTALEEQLGLKLERTTGPVQTLVIDHVEPPTPN